MGDKVKLSEAQRAVLRHISDGALYNPLAWPLMDDGDGPLTLLRCQWDTAWLVAQGLAKVMEDNGDTIWIRITDEGRAALAQEDGGTDG